MLNRLLTIAITVVFTCLAAKVWIGYVDHRVVAVAFAVITAHTLFGFAVGANIPTVVAVPSILIVGYSWMVLPIAVEPLWLRHLTGVWFTCCQVSTTLAPAAISGAFVVAAGLSGMALFLLRIPLSAQRLILSATPLVVAFSIGAALVRDLGPDPVVPRSSSVLVYSLGQPRICLWPEHRERLEEVVAITTEASVAWQEFGISVPTEFSEQEQQALPTDSRSFGISQDSQHGDILYSLAYSLLPSSGQCEDRPFLGGAAEEYIIAWLADTGGLPRSESERRFSPDILRTITVVRSLPLEQQQTWLERNLSAWQACDVAPQLEPDV